VVDDEEPIPVGLAAQHLMISLAGTHVPPGLHSVRDTMVKFRANFERMLEDRLRRGVQAGDLAPDTDVTELASFFGTVFRGIAVQACDGKSTDHLLDWRGSQCGSGPCSQTARLVLSTSDRATIIVARIDPSAKNSGQDEAASHAARMQTLPDRFLRCE
jgi:hypothetical protein